MARDADCSERCVFRPKETGYVKQAQLVAYLRFRFGPKKNFGEFVCSPNSSLLHPLHVPNMSSR